MTNQLSRFRRGAAAISLALLSTASMCYDRDDYATGPERLDKALMLEASSTTVPADNFSRITITARIDAAATGDRRIVKFSTTGGVLSGGTIVNGVAEVTADGNGVASVDLTSDLSQRVVRVRAEIKGDANFARELDVTFTAPATDIIRFVVVPTQPEADGQSPATITAELSSIVPRTSQTVQFTASTGFVGAAAGTSTISATPDAAMRRATVELRTPTTAQRVRVTAAVGTFQRDTAVDFVPAVPHSITLTPDAISITSAQSTVVRARLLRATGKVSPGTFVTFEPVDENGSPAGVMRDVTPSDDNGNATARFDAAGITKATTVTIRASVRGASPTSVTTIKVTPATP
jgi:hypothetical protein